VLGVADAERSPHLVVAARPEREQPHADADDEKPDERQRDPAGRGLSQEPHRRAIVAGSGRPLFDVE
jgi:hypothetical protein